MFDFGKRSSEFLVNKLALFNVLLLLSILWCCCDEDEEPGAAEASLTTGCWLNMFLRLSLEKPPSI